MESFILFPAYGIGAIELRCCIESLHQRHQLDRLLVVAPPTLLEPLPPLHGIADDLSDAKRVVEKTDAWAHAHQAQFEAVVGIDEELHFSLSRTLATHFGLPFPSARTCALASNKWLCKQAFVEHGVPTSAFTRLSEADLDAAATIGYPNVLKVLSGTQSQFLFRNDSPKDLIRNISRLKKATLNTFSDPRFEPQPLSDSGQFLYPKHQFLLESFVGGIEFSCDFLVQADHIALLRITRKLPGPTLGLFGGYLLVPPPCLSHHGIDEETLISVCHRIVRAFGIHHGVCMVDFKVDRGSIHVLESSIRPGFSAFNHLMAKLLGYTSLAVMIAAAMNEPIPLGYPSSEGAVLYLIAPPGHENSPIDLSGLHERTHDLGIIATHVYDTEGTASDVDSTPLIRGYVLVQPSDSSGIDKLMNILPQIVRYETRP